MKKSKIQRLREKDQRSPVIFGVRQKELAFRPHPDRLIVYFHNWADCEGQLTLDLDALQELVDWLDFEEENTWPTFYAEPYAEPAPPANPAPLVLSCKEGVFTLSRDGCSYKLLIENLIDKVSTSGDVFLMDYDFTYECLVRLARQLYISYYEEEERKESQRRKREEREEIKRLKEGSVAG